MGDGSAETRRSAAGKSLWGRVYRARILAGLEVCRRCGNRDHLECPLTFDHIVAVSLGGAGDISNVTILCVTCNHLKDQQRWDQRSLKAEEDVAPPDRQWSKLAYADLFRRRYECVECGGWWIAKTNRRMSIHPTADGMERCPGTHRRVPDGSVAAVLEHSWKLAGHSDESSLPVVPQPRVAVERVVDSTRDRRVVWSSG